MIFGKNKFYRAMIVLLFVSRSAWAEHSLGLTDLFNDFAQNKTCKVSFVQRRYLSSTDDPLISRGYLIYRAPDYLAQVVTDPAVRSYIAEGTWLIFKKGDTVSARVKNTEAPNVWHFTQVLTAVLSGNLQHLQTDFKLSLSGTKQSWVLTLVPNKIDFGNIHKIQISGSQGQTQAITVQYADASLLSLSLGVKSAT